MFDDKVVFVTGGTGSFGKAFIKRLFAEHKPKKVIVFSRDEMKQYEMKSEFGQTNSIRFLLGDVRDKDRLSMALSGADFVIHAAALKIVPIAEEDPFECIKTNIFGAMNVIEASLQSKSVTKVVALSTDKASSPINLYGASKLASDKLFSAANNLKGQKEISFSIVRYGNVMGSRGSVIPFFLRQQENGELPITHPEMTRFMITLDQGIDLVLHAFKDGQGGEIFVRKIPSMKVTDIATAIAPNCEQKIIGTRPGEKLHESMISQSEASLTYEYDDYFKILPNWLEHSKISEYSRNGTKVSSDFQYDSNTNDHWMSQTELKKWILENY